MSNKSTPLETLKQKQTQLAERINRLESAEKTKERKRETRRKILVGAFYLDQARESGELKQLYEKMNSYLTRKFDRKLFDLL